MDTNTVRERILNTITKERYRIVVLAHSWTVYSAAFGGIVCDSLFISVVFIAIWKAEKKEESKQEWKTQNKEQSIFRNNKKVITKEKKEEIETVRKPDKKYGILHA